MAFVYSGLIGQKTGTVRYGEIQSMGMGAPIGADYNSVLVFNQNSSLYMVRKDSIEGGRINEFRKYGDNNQQYRQSYITNPKGFLYRNDNKNKMFYSRDIGFNNVKEDLP